MINLLKRYLVPREQTIKNDHDQLEELVAQRTVELKLINEQLYQEIAQRKHAEADLLKSKERFRILFETAPLAHFSGGKDGRLLMVNQRTAQLFGYEREDMVGREIFSICADTPAGAGQAQKVFERFLQGEEINDQPIEMRHRDGSHFWVSLTVRPLLDELGNVVASQSMLVDITESRRAQELIRASLQEKELLLKEIHHRVKNNLQIISSLLDLQADSVDDQKIRGMLQESRGRVRSMALVHEQLYQSPYLSKINIVNYVEVLGNYLQRVYSDKLLNVSLAKEVLDIALSVETAVPLGLIINELVSNAYKHAFVDGRSGQIHIQLLSLEENQMRLIIEDNGIGFPEDIEFRRSPSLGLTIIMTLVTQLQGQIELILQNGTRFELTFPYKMEGER